jgi:hypothetical protein
MRENFTHYATAKKSSGGFLWHFAKNRLAPALLGNFLELVLTARA